MVYCIWQDAELVTVERQEEFAWLGCRRRSLSRTVKLVIFFAPVVVDKGACGRRQRVNQWRVVRLASCSRGTWFCVSVPEERVHRCRTAAMLYLPSTVRCRLGWLGTTWSSSVHATSALKCLLPFLTNTVPAFARKCSSVRLRGASERNSASLSTEPIGISRNVVPAARGQ